MQVGAMFDYCSVRETVKEASVITHASVDCKKLV